MIDFQYTVVVTTDTQEHADQVMAGVRDAFWRHGFAGTSMDQLAAATGLHKPSLYGAFGAQSRPIVWIESGLELGVLLILYTGLVCVLGLRVSLTSRTNVSAVMYSVGILIVVVGILTAGGMAFVEAARGEFGAFVAPFTPFTLISYLVDPSAPRPRPPAGRR